MDGKYDKVIIGILVGILVPIIGQLLVSGVFEMLTENDLMDAAGSGASRRERTIYLLAICCNIIPFNYFKNTRMDNAIRGVVFPTVIYIGLWIFRYYEILF